VVGCGSEVFPSALPPVERMMSWLMSADQKATSPSPQVKLVFSPWPLTRFLAPRFERSEEAAAGAPPEVPPEAERKNRSNQLKERALRDEKTACRRQTGMLCPKL